MLSGWSRDWVVTSGIGAIAPMLLPGLLRIRISRASLGTSAAITSATEGARAIEGSMPAQNLWLFTRRREEGPPLLALHPGRNNDDYTRVKFLAEAALPKCEVLAELSNSAREIKTVLRIVESEFGRIDFELVAY